MTDYVENPTASFLPVPKRKRGRPKKVVVKAEDYCGITPYMLGVPAAPGSPATKMMSADELKDLGEKGIYKKEEVDKVVKPRPLCEKEPQGYSEKVVIWGTEAQNPWYHTLGIALCYDKSRGDHIIMYPVTEDEEEPGNIRWRYRRVKGPAPYSYAMITIEPNSARRIGQALIEFAGKVLGTPDDTIKTEIKVIEEVKKEVSSSRVDELMKKLGGLG